MKQKLLTLLLITLIIIPLGKTCWQRRFHYLAPFNLEQMKTAYENSQYFKEDVAAWIPDEMLFSYAGWYYLQGGSPILVNPENPPLMKYLVGISIKIFNNEKIPSLIFAILSLLTFFLLSRLFLKKTWLALLPLAIFAWGKLFQEQLLYLPLFEVFAFTFLNLAFYFFIKAEKDSRYFLAVNFFLGTLWATRPWMATVPLIVSWLAYFYLKKDFQKFFSWLISTPIAVVVLVLVYLRLFFEGYNLYRILSVQKWIFWYHQSRLINFGSIWPFIYLKRWYVWWGDKPFLPVDQWNIFWPVFTTLALIFSILVLLKTMGIKKKWLKNFKFDQQIVVLALWIIFYLAFLSIGNINSRYVFYLLPYTYLLGIYSIAK